MRHAIKLAGITVATLLVVGWLGFRIGGVEKRVTTLESPSLRKGFLTGGSFIPQGGGGGGSVTTSSPPLTGNGTGGSPIDFSDSGCVLGDAWISDGAGGWTCDPAGAAGAGDLTAVQVGDGLSVASGTGPIPVVSIDEAGCTAGDVQTFVSAGVWSCDLPPPGDLTAITVSGGGLTLTSGTGPVPDLAVNTTAIQARVTGTCAAGSSIRVIDSAGAVTCEPDDDSGDITAVQAGRGLAVTNGTGPIPSLRTMVPNDGWRCYDELVSTPATTGGCFIAVTANSGTVANVGANVDDSRPGTFTFTTVTNTASRAAIIAPANATTAVVIGTNANISFETALQLSALSDGTDTYIARAGFLDSAVGEPVDGVFFRYNQTSSTAMQCVVRANNVETSVNSSFTVAATAWTKLRVEVNGTGSVGFFINGSEVCAATSVANLPIGTTRGTAFGFSFIRSAGTASRTFDLDYLDVMGSFVTTPR